MTSVLQAYRWTKSLALITSVLLLFVVPVYALWMANFSIVFRDTDLLVLKMAAATYPWAVLALCSVAEGFGLIVIGGQFDFEMSRLEQENQEVADWKRYLSQVRDAVVLLGMIAGFTLASGGINAALNYAGLRPPDSSAIMLVCMLIPYYIYQLWKDHWKLPDPTQVNDMSLRYVGLPVIVLIAYMNVNAEIIF